MSFEGPGKRRVQISFDELNKIRILEEEDFKQTTALSTECTQFNSSMLTLKLSLSLSLSCYLLLSCPLVRH